MTTVCAVARDGRVVMGADSMAMRGNEPLPGVVKVIEVVPADWSANPGNPSLLLGFSGRSALIDAVRSDLRIDAVPGPGDDPQLWAAAIARAVTDIAADWRLLDGADLDGSALLGWSGRLWAVCTSCATEFTSGIGAIGSGADYATGALHAVDTWPRGMGEAESVEDAVRTAVTIASHLDVYSGGPPLVLAIP